MRVTFLCCVLVSACLFDGALPTVFQGLPGYTRDGGPGSSSGIRWQESDVSRWNTDFKKQPYQLQLDVDGEQICEAVIISKRWAVTAAHCLFDDNGVKQLEEAVMLRAGGTYGNVRGQIHSITDMIINNRYNNTNFDYDIALLKVWKPFKFGPKVQKISLPAKDESVAEGDMAVGSGWGYLTIDDEESNYFANFTIPIISQYKCAYNYMKFGYPITDRMMCAGSVHERSDRMCQGEAGGALAVKGKLMGVVTWGLGCAVPRFPGVYARIPKFRHWIMAYTGI